VAYPPNKISKTGLKMQAFSACFMKFCLALNSYELDIKLQENRQQKSVRQLYLVPYGRNRTKSCKPLKMLDFLTILRHFYR